MFLIDELIEILSHSSGPNISLNVRAAEMNNVDFAFSGGDQGVEFAVKPIKVEAVTKEINLIEIVVNERMIGTDVKGRFLS